MSQITFPSLADPDQKMYVWNQSGFDSPWRFDSRIDSLAGNAAYYQTYGDGTTQHSNESPVSPSDALDYLASLAMYLVDNHDTETLDCLVYDWPHPECHNGRKQVAFALTVKHKDNDKTRYYNLDDCKISGADSKRHDKRWTEIVQWMDGTLGSAFGLCNQSHNAPLACYGLIKYVDEVSRENGNGGHSHRDMSKLARFIPDDSDDWSKDNQYANNLDNAYNAVLGFIEGHRATTGAIRSADCLQNNYCRNVLGQGLESAE